MGKPARLLALVLTATTFVPPQVAPPHDRGSNDPSYQEIPLDGPSVQAETTPYGMVGITWPQGVAGVTAKVRVEQNGKWTDWHALRIEDEHGPDPLANEGNQRAGTEPLWGEHLTGTGRATYFATRDVFYSVATGPHSTAPVFCTRHRGISVGRAL
jgi:hypothetical protein